MDAREMAEAHQSLRMERHQLAALNALVRGESDPDAPSGHIPWNIWTPMRADQNAKARIRGWFDERADAVVAIVTLDLHVERSLDEIAVLRAKITPLMEGARAAATAVGAVG